MGIWNGFEGKKREYKIRETYKKLFSLCSTDREEKLRSKENEIKAKKNFSNSLEIFCLGGRVTRAEIRISSGDGSRFMLKS